MKELNLEAKTLPQQKIKEYLEQNASDSLAEKINNGVPVEKDGKNLTSKKTLDGFMSYANSEARKMAEKGVNCACVEDSVVYGWAVHYFEEDSIEGTLFNEDGTEYVKPKPAPKKQEKAAKSKPVPVPKKVEAKAVEKPVVNEPNQMSLFDFLI